MTFSTTIRNKLATYYSCESLSSSNLLDRSDNLFDLSPNNAAPTVSTGKNGNGIWFNGTDQRLRSALVGQADSFGVRTRTPVSTTRLTPANAVTIFGWFYMPSGVYSSGTQQIAILRGNSNSYRVGVRFFSASSVSLDLNIATASNSTNLLLVGSVALDQWNFFALRYSTGAYHGRYNATVGNSVTPTGQILYTGDNYLILGGQHNTFTQCRLDEIGVADSALSDAELDEIYNSGIGRFWPTASLSVGVPQINFINSTRVDLSASATGGTRPYTYQWKKNNVDISGATSATVSDTSATSTDYALHVTDADASTANGSKSVVLPVSLTETNVTDSTIKKSAMNWVTVTGGLSSNNPGAWMKTSVTCTGNGTINLELDHAPYTSVPANETPILQYRLNGGAWTRKAMPIGGGISDVTLYSELAAGTYELEFGFGAVGDFSAMPSRWTAPIVCRLVPRKLKTSGCTLSTPAAKPIVLVYGDSITEGVEAIWDQGHGGSPVGPAEDNDAFRAWAGLLSDHFGWDQSIVAFSSQGYGIGGYGGVPQFTTAWDDIDAANSRLTGGLLSTQPAVILINHGTNTVSSAQVQTMLGTLRTAAPDAIIIQINTFGQVNAATVVTGYNSYQLATPDAKAYFVDLAADLIAVGVHPTLAEHQVIADLLIPVLEPIIDANTTIEVTSPTESEVVLTGSKTITWTSLNVSGTVDILFSNDNGSSFSVIVPATANDGSHAYTFSPNQVGTQCIVRVRSTNDNAVFDDSGVFVLATTQPGAGGAWKLLAKQLAIEAGYEVSE